MTAPALLAVALAVVLETLVGEPPTRLHPVAWFGRAVAPLDREWRRPRLVGALGTVALTLAAAAAVAMVVVAAGLLSPWAAAATAGLALLLTTSLRRLLAAATDVVAASADDIDAAREGLLALAGRDASALGAGELRSAAVESAAENLADGLVAPLLAFTVLAPLSLALAAAGAAWVKAVNTMDSMLGYQAKPVGWAPARLDDAVMWVPARLAALALAVVAGAPASLRRARAWTDGVPSPNSGWPMGVLAAALDVRLTKPGVYTLNPDAVLPTVAKAQRGVRLVGVAGALAYLASAGVVAWS